MKLIEKAGFKVIELLEEQIAKGIDSDGKQYSYSTKPFATPEKYKNQKQLEKEGKLKTFKTSQGKFWSIVLGGYKEYRKLNNRNPEGDYLQFSGKMLNSISSRIDSDKRVSIYFTDPQSALKAYWLNESGVGKSRKLWKFFALNKNSENTLYNFVKENASDDQDLITEVLTKMTNNLK
jgi:hypothetical protein